VAAALVAASGKFMKASIKEVPMRKLTLWAVACLWASLLLAAGKYQPLNVKTGEWETTVTTSVSGAPPIPPGMLEKLTPEQRARFAAAMGKRASGKPTTRTSKSCLTKERLEKNPFNDRKECTGTVLTSTASKMEIEEVCTEEDSKIDSKVHFEAIDSEHVKGTVQSTVIGAGSGGKPMNISGTITSKWIGAVCTEKDDH
jgi:Protein of unknown function (DUF3617)